MPFSLISYPPEGAASNCLWRSPRALAIGRSVEDGWRLEHASISRLHARIVPAADGGWSLHDAGSKNGTFLDGVRVAGAVALRGDAWLRFGDVHCEFLLLDDASADRAEERGVQRRAMADDFTARIARLTALPDVLGESLRAIVDLADCERGFVLLAGPDGLRVRASHGIATADLRSRSFQGSASAARRALRDGVAVVIHDVGADAELRARASVLAGGLRSLVCLPLRAGEETIGLVYADSRRPRATIDALELDLLRAFTERAALWILARRVDDALLQLAARPPEAWAEAFADAQPGTVA